MTKDQRNNLCVAVLGAVALLVLGLSPLCSAVGHLFTLSDANDIPITYYGKLEDQFTNAVAGATVRFNVESPRFNLMHPDREYGQVTSDSDGRFTITGYWGSQLNIIPEKSGYVPRNHTNSSDYHYGQSVPGEARAHPDPQHPVVSRMWKQQGGEPLVKIDSQFKVALTNGPILIDLVTGKPVAGGGDLKMWFCLKEPAAGEKRSEKWVVRAAAVDGGLRDIPGWEWQTTYAAPADGYEPDKLLVPEQEQQAFWWTLSVNSRGGLIHTKLALSLLIPSPTPEEVVISLHGFANTNRSGNWEESIGR